jgi:hypothetical protein
MFVRIALVSLHPAPSPQAVPLACGFLKSVASVATPSVEVVLIDAFGAGDHSACIERLVAAAPVAIGFSLYIWNRQAGREMALKLRRRLPQTLLFAGGPEVTADPSGTLEQPGFDFIIRGEGEAPFAEICRRLAFGADISGIPALVRPGEPIPASHPEPLFDLDAIPSPYLGGLLECSRYPGLLWQLSRGCGFSCTFCFDSRGRHGVRRFSLERVEAELRHFAAQGVSQVFVLDSTFNQDMARAKAILRLIAAIAPHIHFHFEVRSEFLDRELAQLFAEITCSLQIGLQSSDSRVLQNVGRTFRPQDFIRRINLLNRTGAVFGLDLIYGLPGDTLSGFRKSLDFALGLYPNHLDVFPLAVLPGTELATGSRAAGLRHLTAPPYTLLSAPTFSAGDMASARRLAAACDIFYSRGKAVAWFNSVANALRLAPSACLERFAIWLEQQRGAGIAEQDLEDRDIWLLQRGFMEANFTGRSLGPLLPLALDLVDYHYHYATVLMTPPAIPPAATPPDSGTPMNTPFCLAPGVRLATFHYDILELLDAGEPDLRLLARRLHPCGSHAVIYACCGEIRTESLPEPCYRFLKRLDGEALPRVIAADLAVSADDADRLLRFALAEGVILSS